MIRRAFLQGAAALAVLSSVAGASRAGDATKAQPRDGQEGMAKDIAMLHGASAGGWCFDTFRGVFEGKAWTVHTPDLIGHGRDKRVPTKSSSASVSPSIAPISPPS